MNREIETDYLVVGAGAMGLAFADEIIHESRDARVVVVDRRAKPGGHWNDAYAFVTLHQPALFYGVNSEKLGSGGKDLVSKAQILGYYERVLKKLEATGRFTFLPLCDYRGDGLVTSMIAPDREYRIRVRKKVVDGTYMNVQVPSTTPPRYEIASGLRIVPINALADLDEPFDRYVVIGAGKTGIDAALYLLERDVDPDRITWIMPNDAWFLNREKTQPKELSADLPAQLRCLKESENLTEAFERLEAEGRVLRLDRDVWPKKYRCATVTDEELTELRRIAHIVRKGRVIRIESSSIEMTEGYEALSSDGSDEGSVLYVDCTADGLAKRPARPVFEDDRITLQSISMCQQVFSASAIAAVELRLERDDEKNAICQPVPHPEFPSDYPACLQQTFKNLDQLGRTLSTWTRRKRLSLGSHMGILGLIRFLITAKRSAIPDSLQIESLAERSRPLS
jgi:hypothetical protein